jgi:hypothetical protein
MSVEVPDAISKSEEEADPIQEEVRRVVEARGGRAKETEVRRIATNFTRAVAALEDSYLKGNIPDEEALDARLANLQQEFERESIALEGALNEAYAEADHSGEIDEASGISSAYETFFKGYKVVGREQDPKNRALREQVEEAISERRARIAKRREALQLLAAAGIEVPEGLVLVDGDSPIVEREERRGETLMKIREFKLMGDAGAIERDRKKGGPVAAVYGVQSLLESVTEYPASGITENPLWQERYFYLYPKGGNTTPQLLAKLKLENFKSGQLPGRIERLPVE